MRFRLRSLHGGQVLDCLLSRHEEVQMIANTGYALQVLSVQQAEGQVNLNLSIFQTISFDFEQPKMENSNYQQSLKNSSNIHIPVLVGVKSQVEVCTTSSTPPTLYWTSSLAPLRVAHICHSKHSSDERKSPISKVPCLDACGQSQGRMASG